MHGAIRRFTGFVTVPIIFVTPLPIGPGWATDMPGFLLSALVYGMVGVMLAAGRGGVHEHPREEPVCTAT